MNDADFRPHSQTLATIGIALATFMQVLDTTIANVALPTIAGNLGVSADQGIWVITSFSVCNAIALPLTGWCSRRFGPVRLFSISIGLFSITSFLCGMAQSMPELIFFRALQGFFAGPLFPMSQTLLLAIFPKAKRGLALALISMLTVVAPIVGPITGGWLTDNYTWPWIFFINVPIGLFAIFVVLTQLKGMPEKIVKAPIDYMGLMLLVLGVATLQVVLDKGNDLDWFESDFILWMSLVAVVALIAFVIWELTEKNPIVKLNLFKNRNFTVGTIVLVLGYSAFFSINLILPQWLQTQMGYTAVWAGLAAAPMGIIPFFLAPIVGNYANRFDLRLLTSMSFIVISSSCFMRAMFNTDVDFQHIAEVQLFMGIGVALFFMPLTSILLSQLSGADIADGSGLATFLRTLGGSFASSLTTWLWNRREIFHYADISENVSIYNQNTLDYMNKIGGITQHNLANVDNQIVHQAYMMSTIDYFTLLGWGFMALIVLIWFAKPPFITAAKRSSSEH